MQRYLAATLPGLLMVMGGLSVSVAADPAASFHSTRAPVPATECQAHVAYDRDLTLPGYLLPTSAGPRTCIPFTTVAAHPTTADRGDFYVDEFTDAKLRERWAACKLDKECHDRVYKQVMARHPPNKEYNLKDPHGRFLLGKIEEKGGDTDLTTIRRPGYFSRPPYNEAIAAVDTQTYMVEFTAPAEAYERLHQNTSADIRIRGWYIQGAGIDDGKGARKRVLIIASGGGGDRVTAIDDPVDKAYVIDPKTGDTIPDDDWPNATTGVKGEAAWRQVWFVLHQAGFDVLALDRRGVGISGGFSDTNTLQQGHDLLKIVADLKSGKGMRALTPAGEVATGHAAAAAVKGGASAEGLPVFFMGSSRGTMSSGWAMTINFDKDCSYDLPDHHSASRRPATRPSRARSSSRISPAGSATWKARPRPKTTVGARDATAAYSSAASRSRTTSCSFPARRSWPVSTPGPARSSRAACGVTPMAWKGRWTPTAA